MSGAGEARRRVLFLCSGNSARSQMAEAIVNARLGETWQAYSAGTRPADQVHPKAIAALKEIGLSHAGRPKPAEEFRSATFDLVVTVCDTAAEECPAWLGPGRRAHCSFPDPAKASGSDEQVMEVFRRLRDAIAREIPALLKTFEEG